MSIERFSSQRHLPEPVLPSLDLGYASRLGIPGVLNTGFEVHFANPVLSHGRKDKPAEISFKALVQVIDVENGEIKGRSRVALWLKDRLKQLKLYQDEQGHVTFEQLFAELPQLDEADVEKFDDFMQFLEDMELIFMDDEGNAGYDGDADDEDDHILLAGADDAISSGDGLRMYFQQSDTHRLLKREEEVTLGKRMEQGQLAAKKLLTARSD
jgi:hypothetical protein